MKSYSLLLCEWIWRISQGVKLVKGERHTQNDLPLVWNKRKMGSNTCLEMDLSSRKLEGRDEGYGCPNKSGGKSTPVEDAVLKCMKSYH